VEVYGAQSYRPSGTAAQLTVVLVAQAIPLPDRVSDETGAALGIPGITAHRAVFGDASVPANRAVIATYFSRSERIDLPFSPVLFANVTLRLLGSDDSPSRRNSKRPAT
jgi:hypothetical protein